ncbi:MAG TPA: VWA domain-containing protein [Thermoanaerobaculia bacterium]|nr:VWA domain-containing protein [Thermoanaerobaculia bacterium]
MRRFPIVFALLVAVAVPVRSHAQVSETITVARILLDVRVTDYKGEAILDLGEGDFAVEIEGKPAKVESVTWVPDTAAARIIAGLDEPQRLPDTDESPAPSGRMFVVFVQTDFARASSRIAGQLKFFTQVEQIVDSMEPEDRVAVFSFDSHLKFRLDFSSDKARILAAIRESSSINEPSWPPVVPNPSLARRMDREQMKNATSSEAALVLIGNALRPIPGPKSLLLMGWGLGERVGGTVMMRHEYPIAKRVLESARATVFALDTTDADYHDLEIGLQTAAADTGGFYAKTNRFPQIAINRLQRTLQGHYELEVRRPDGIKPGTHRVEVTVKRKSVNVLAPASYMDR